MPRSSLTAVVGVLAALLLPLGLLSVWVHEVVSDTDRYVETVAPLADDEAVTAAAATELQREALRLVARSGVTLVPGAEELVVLVVRDVVDSAAFREVWVEANRSAHRRLVAALERRSDAGLDDQGRITVDLGEALQTVVRQLTLKGHPVPDTSGVDASFVVMDADQLATARRAYALLDALGFWLPVAWAAAVLLTLVLARRRLAGAARLAAASVAGLALLALALALARDAVTADLPQRDVAQAVWDVVVRGLWRQLEVCGAVAAVVAVLAGLAGRVSNPSRLSPDGASTYA